METSKDMQEYFDRLVSDVDRCHTIAKKARSQGFDPEEYVDVKLAKNMAERVEGLMSNVAPGLMGTGFTKRIMELEEEYSPLDWRVALRIGEEVAKEKFCKFKDETEAMEVGIRAGFTYHTGGIVSAPLEGFVMLRIKKTKDGKDFLAPVYAGPIRGAGGTAASFSLVMTDYIRHVMGYAKYDPTDEEVERFKTEIEDYHDRITNLQYRPSRDEIDFLARALPIQIDGEPTEKFDVSNHKDLPRVETNRIRGGVCLVFAEGISQKAPKVWKRLSVWGKELGLEWDFLETFLSLQKKIKAKDKKTTEKKTLSPNYTFIADLVAGRPVLTDPMASGGFRLRYGRGRTSGFSAASINPATMYLLNKFIAIGTQLKMERPGKAASITSCTRIDGPIVKLEDGVVMKIDSLSDAKRYYTLVEKILYLGDILFNYGDFSENGHKLVPVGYNEDWWLRHLEKASVDHFGTIDPEKIAELASVPYSTINEIFESSAAIKISATDAIRLSMKLKIPLHPEYTFFWKEISSEDLKALCVWLKSGNMIKEGSELQKMVVPMSKEKHILEKLGLPHKSVNNEYVVIEKNNLIVLDLLLRLQEDVDINTEKSTLENINNLSRVRVMDKSGTFIGARMGRPEKAKMRKLTGSPHVLFPIGTEGGRLRSFQAALEEGCVTSDFPLRRCNRCAKETILSVCETCGEKTEQLYYCETCGILKEPECIHGKLHTYQKRKIDISHYFQAALKKTKEKVYPDLIKGVRGTMNADHVPENIIKGILRAKHGIYVNKDGTVRFDMSELPITHFKPKEIGTPVEKLISLGYTRDIKGNKLTDKEQILEIKPQDVLLTSALDSMDEQSNTVLVKVAGFVDELLKKMYGLKPYYNVKNQQDLVGHLVIGLAPHISAGTVGRIIGFTDTQGLFAHPLFHAAMRRDCDGDEACVILLMDAFLNFSRRYLPDRRGAKTMDAPLVLTSVLNPAEVDDMAHGLDIVWEYPLELYEAADAMKAPWDVKIEQIKHVLGKKRQFEKMGFTHDTENINIGVTCSAYKALPSMEEKLKGQMEIAEKVCAVNESNVAKLVIEKHFLRDTKGNLRKFSTQGFRCVKCNQKYRRPPLAGKCSCGGKIIFTVSYGSVIKYLEPTLSLARKYDVGPYLEQTLEILQRRIDGVFGREKEKQEGLGKWFG